MFSSFFFFNDTAITEIYTLSLHDALPISIEVALEEIIVRAPHDGLFPQGLVNVAAKDQNRDVGRGDEHLIERLEALTIRQGQREQDSGDRKSTRLNSSHTVSSYAVFCLKK